MNSNDTALQESIARAIYENRVAMVESDLERRSWPAWDEHEKADADEWRDMATAVLPIIRAEVAKARAEAWDEGNHAGTRDQANWDGWRYPRGYQEHLNPYRETEQGNA